MYRTFQKTCHIAQGNNAPNDFGSNSGSPFSDEGLLVQNPFNSILTSKGCGYGMYDHSDTTNADLLAHGWSPLTFSQLNGVYKHDFMEYFNNNNGLTSLLTWRSNNCCFSFGELDDQYLTLNTDEYYNDTRRCIVFPASASIECNPVEGYPAGTRYIWHSNTACYVEDYVDELGLPTANVVFGLANTCHQSHNPGIWKRCRNLINGIRTLVSINTTGS